MFLRLVAMCVSTELYKITPSGFHRQFAGIPQVVRGANSGVLTNRMTSFVVVKHDQTVVTRVHELNRGDYPVQLTNIKETDSWY